MASAKTQEIISFTQNKNLNQLGLFNQLRSRVSLYLLTLCSTCIDDGVAFFKGDQRIAIATAAAKQLCRRRFHDGTN